MERELISRGLTNILNAKHFYNYALLNGDDLYEQLVKLIQALTEDPALRDQGMKILADNRSTIDKIIKSKNTYREYQKLCEDLRGFKRQCTKKGDQK